MEKEEYLKVYRHSMAHILAKAVIELFGKENVQYAIGPQIEDGCYYDFTLPRTLTKDDFKTIEDKMREILKRKENWTRKEVTKAEALDIFKDQKFKTELIQDLPENETITVYYTGDDYVDLCRGPHVDNSAELLNAAYKIKSVSGSYWRGDETRDQLQRIYLYVFPSKQELKDHLALVKEAMERDHKKLGPALDLFMFDETAPGMPYWLPRGWKLFNALLDYWRSVHEVHGYTEISAPLIQKKDLWVTSGHWAHYMDGMFVLPGRDEDGNYSIDAANTYAVKPMNCPNAIKYYMREQRSYKDLPMRINTVDVIHRKEKSGELNGLFRVQMFRQDDSHNLITNDQIESEISDIMEIAGEILLVHPVVLLGVVGAELDDNHLRLEREGVLPGEFVRVREVAGAHHRAGRNAQVLHGIAIAQHRLHLGGIAVDRAQVDAATSDLDAARTASNDVKIDLGSSEIFSEDELKEAVIQIKCKFASFRDCELHSITYAGDETCSDENIARMNDLDEGAEYTQAIKFTSEFHAYNSPVFDPDSEQKDYEWWLARGGEDGWQLVTWGY